ncbi:glycosyltransferase family 4 protein [Shewanella dokdonensis]|uniref:Glycosyltransferase family 4 protein n=1 Tax=Shewanella dokdonensis TaxID=712036 RepID=A0ABX8DHI4_9GAMM|nr:glycosyltransferase family 4 protein [Shewanella dokdonensis]MCL1073882.1 glycosyltransferase family 4 protein [Shewanella dokdonensis]QVK23661.1 glycosyltransferase family 4 protein [Shewanella dokdonensis]
MKIAIIHSHLNNRGGSQRYVIEIANNFKKLGVDVNIFCYEYNKKLCFQELTYNLNIKKIYTRENVFEDKNSYKKSNILKKYLKLFYNVKMIRRIANSIGIDYLFSLYVTNKNASKVAELMLNNHDDYDLIFAHEEPLSVYAAIKYKKNKNIPIYWFCYDSIEKWFLEWKVEYHNSFIRNFLLKQIYFKYDRYLINKFVDKSAVLDKKMSQRYFKLYGKLPLIRRGGLPKNVIGYGRENKIREKFNLSDNINIILLLTRFVKYKRVHDIFDVYMKLDDGIRKNIFIYINAPVTDQLYYQWCIDKYKEVLENNNIILDLEFSGNDNEMYDMYLSSDIFVFPNDNQTWGHAPLESMGCGTAALVSSGCGISEVVKSITPEAVFEVGNIHELTDMIENMVKSRSYKKISEKQKDYVKNNLVWEDVCKIYIADFKDILGNKHV